MSDLRCEHGRKNGSITITVDGRALACSAGETVATALLAGGIRKLRTSPRTGSARGAFCMMGVCQECAVLIDDRVQQACLVRVRQGLRIELGGVK